MKRKITIVVLYLIALLPLSGAKQLLLHAQGFNLTDRMFLESDRGEIYMFTWSVLADSNLIFSAGISLVQNEHQPFTFQTLLSAYDVEGQKKFQKHLSIPSCFSNTSGGYNEISKLGFNKYMLGGVGWDSTVRKQFNGIYQPYIYFFDKNGDSLNFFLLRDTVQDRIFSSVYGNKNGEIIGVGAQCTATGFFDSSAGWGGEIVPDSTYFWLCKLNSSGQLLWHKYYPHLRSEQGGGSAIKLLISSDQTIYTIAGILDYGYPYLLQTDSAGNELWYKPLQLRESYDNHPDAQFLLNECSVDIAASPGGGYYFISSTPYTATVDTFVGSQLAFYYGKLDEQGDTLWTKQYQPYNEYNTNIGRQIQVAVNGDLIMTGNIRKNVPPYGYKEDRACVFRTDSLGNVKWYREPMNYNTQQNGITTHHLLYSLSLTPGRDGILAGGSYIGHYDPFLATQPNDGNTFSWLILMDSLGHRCGEDTVMLDAISPCDNVTFPGPTAIYQPDAGNGRLMLYPNPAQDRVYIRREGDAWNEKELQLTFCDMQGRVIISRKLKRTEQSVAIASLTPGIYLVTVKTPDGKLISRQKLIKE